MNDTKENEEKEEKKIGMVLSAGGSAGAFAAGVINHLIEVKKKKYNLVIGSSTGSLMAPSVAFGNSKNLVNMYGSVSNKDVMDIDPFTKKRTLSFWKIIWNLIVRRRKSLGSNRVLLETIRKSFGESEFRAIQLKKDVDILVCVNNSTVNAVEYKSLRESVYDQFTKWMWASCTEPILFENYIHNEHEYNDGAVLQHTAIEKAIQEGCQEIDVICNKPIHTPKENWRSSKFTMKGFLDVILRTFSQQVHNNFVLNMKIGQLLAEKHGIKLTIYSPPYSLTNDSLNFTPQKMKEWANLGFVTAKMHNSPESEKETNKKPLLIHFDKREKAN